MGKNESDTSAAIKKFYIFDRDDTLSVEHGEKQQHRLINPRFISKFLSSLNKQGHYVGIATSSAVSLNYDGALKALRTSDVGKKTIAVDVSQYAYSMFSNKLGGLLNACIGGIGLDSDELSGYQQIILDVAKDKKEDFFEKYSESVVVYVKLSGVTVGINARIFYENYELFSDGQFKLFQLIDNLGQKQCKPEHTDGLKNIGIVSIEAENFQEITADNIHFIDDRPEIGKLIDAAGFQFIHADTAPARWGRRCTRLSEKVNILEKAGVLQWEDGEHTVYGLTKEINKLRDSDIQFKSDENINNESLIALELKINALYNDNKEKIEEYVISKDVPYDNLVKIKHSQKKIKSCDDYPNEVNTYIENLMGTLQTTSTHSLFLPVGYELAIMPEKLYRDGQPQEGQLYPKQGVFYIEVKNNILEYIVIGSDKQLKRSQITLEEYNANSDIIIETWPSTDNLDNYVRLLPDIWNITAERGHSIPDAQYRKSREEEYPSDHLLISGQAGDYNILSWNTMGAGATGFSASQYQEFQEIFNKNERLVPKDDSVARRHTQIITTLTEAATAQDASIIHLQETNVDAKELKESLGDNWTVIDSVDYYPYENEENKDQRDIADATKNRVITCYRHDKFTAGEIISETVSRSQHRYLKVELTDKQTGKTTDCYNIWSIYNDFPDEHEKMYRDYIDASKAKGHDVIIAGDSNTRFMPADATQKNITTGLIPPNFLGEHPSYVASGGSCQIPDYPDTILHYSCEENKVSQPIFNVINKQGQIHEEPAPNLDSVPDYELEMRKEYRAVFSIDALCGDKQSGLLSLENYFKEKLGEKITVRETANSLNERGIIFRFPKKDSKLYKVFEKFQQAYSAIKGGFYQSQVGETHSQQFFCFSVPAELKDNVTSCLQSKTKINLFFKLQSYITDRKTEFTKSDNKPFNSTFGRLVASKVGLAYTYKQKMAAAEALSIAIVENKQIPKEHLEVLSQGRLADIFFECRDKLPGFKSLLPSDLKPSYYVKSEAAFGLALFNNRGNENSQSEIANNTNENTPLLN